MNYLVIIERVAYQLVHKMLLSAIYQNSTKEFEQLDITLRQKITKFSCLYYSVYRTEKHFTENTVTVTGSVTTYKVNAIQKYQRKFIGYK